MQPWESNVEGYEARIKQIEGLLFLEGIAERLGIKESLEEELATLKRELMLRCMKYGITSDYL